MKLTDNPILRTHLLLAHRQGFHLVAGAAALVALVAAWWSLGEVPTAYTNSSAQAWVASTYTTVLVLQAAVGALGAWFVARVIADHRARGLLDANRLTPMTSEDLAIGYWIGPMLGPLAVVGIGTAYSLFLALAASNLDVLVVAKTQAVVFGTALTAGLVTAWLALELENPNQAAPAAAILGFVSLAFLGMEDLFIGNFLIGAPAVVEAMSVAGGWTPRWNPTLFGQAVDGVALTVGAQALAAMTCWFAVSRKLRDPATLGISRPFAVAATSTLILAQFGLLFGPLARAAETQNLWQAREMASGLYAFVGVTSVIATVFLARTAPELRRQVLTLSGRPAMSVFRDGAVPVALALSAIIGLTLAAIPGLAGGPRAGAAVDVLVCLVGLGAAVEAARFSESRRAGVVLGLLLVGGLMAPVFAAWLFDTHLAAMSLGVSGGVLLAETAHRSYEAALAGVGVHAVAAVVALLVWQRQLRGLVVRTAGATT